MEHEDLPPGDRLRCFALSKSVELHTAWLNHGDIKCSPELQLDDIQTVATILHAFLKGETK